MTSPRWYIKKFMKNYSSPIVCIRGFPGSSVVNNLPANARIVKWVGKIPWRKKWQPIPVFLPGEPYGQRCLVGYRPWGSKRVKHD